MSASVGKTCDNNEQQCRWMCFEKIKTFFVKLKELIVNIAHGIFQSRSRKGT